MEKIKLWFWEVQYQFRVPQTTDKIHQGEESHAIVIPMAVKTDVGAGG
jgi:hypothetical protein